MPSASPEARTKRRGRSRSRSPNDHGRPADRKSSSDAKQISQISREHKNQSRHSRHGEHDRSSRHRLEPSTADNRSAERRSKRDDERADVDARDRTARMDCNHQERFSHNNRERSSGRRDRRPDRSSTFTNVRIKEEPTSEDEDTRRRNRRSRFAAAAASLEAATARTDGERRQNRQPTEFSNSNRPVKKEDGGEEDEKKPREKVNFGLSGKLAEDTNVFNGVVIKYNEPIEARKPSKRWRLYPFKGDESLPILPVHRQSAYLLGRDRKIADIPVDHPSCSKQHAVLQYRAVQYTRQDGRLGRRIRPYIIDLESANGTFVNNARIDPKRYVELMERDVIKFGFSSREYVLLHEGSATADDEDDENVAEAEAIQADDERLQAETSQQADS